MMRALILALAIAGCAGSEAPRQLPAPQLPERAGVDPIVAARAEGIEFRAVADGLVVDIFREDRVRLTRTDIGEVFIFPKPTPLYPRWNGEIYSTAFEGRRLTIRIRDDRRCERDDSALYPTKVELIVDDAVLDGCGRRF